MTNHDLLEFLVALVSLALENQVIGIHTSKGTNSIGNSRGGCTFQHIPYFPRACNLDFGENYYEHWVGGKGGRGGIRLTIIAL